jgi:hypothetical protein
MVNFGVVAVARATGVAADQFLELRCECGVAGCSARIRIAGSVYVTVTEADLLVVSSLHATGATERGEHWFAVARPDDVEDGVGFGSSRSATPSLRAGDVRS